MSQPELIPARLSKTPISAPLWVWLLYGAMLLVMCVMARTWPIPAVLFTAGFSFQFWTFAVWRGFCRRQEELNGR